MVKLPGPINVQTINPGVLKPGNTPNAFSQNADAPYEALSQVGKAFGGIGEQFAREAQKQQNLVEATKLTEIDTGFGGEIHTERTRLQDEADFSEPTTLNDYADFLDKKKSEYLSKLGNVSPEAKAKAGANLTKQAQEAYQTAEVLHVAANKKRSNDALAGSANSNAADATENPELVESSLDKYSETLDSFHVSPEMHREALKSGAGQIATGAINGNIANGNFAAARALLKDERFKEILTPEARLSLGTRIEEAADGKARDFLESLDPKARVTLLEKAIKGKTGTLADELDLGDRSTKLREARNEVRIEADRQRTEGDKARAKINERISSDLKIKVDAGEASVTDIEDAFDKHVISGSERASWIGIINKTSNYQGIVLGALTGSSVLDPKNEKDRNAADTYFDKVVTPNLAKASPDEAKTAITQYVERLGIMPERLRGQIRGGLRAGGPELRATAADIIDRLSEAAPHALDDFSTEDIAEGKAIAGMIRDGVPKEQALAYADQMQKLPKDVIDLRKKRLTESNGALLTNSVKSLEAGAADRGWFSWMWSRAPAAADAAQAEFGRDFERAYLLTGDANVAAKTAQATIKRAWGVSNVNGQPQFMKYAPETSYGVLDHGPEDGAWIRNQLLEDVTKGAAFDPSKGDIANRVVLAPDMQTGRDLTYGVMLKNEMGAFEPMLDAKGRAMRWKPDFATSAKAAEIKAKKAKEVAEAKARKEYYEGQVKIGPMVPMQ